MSDIPKVTRVTTVATPKAGEAPHGGQWDSQLKTQVNPNSSVSVKTLQIELERTPQNITNQNATLSPRQMAEYLSRELARRTAQNKAVKGKYRRNIDGINDDLSEIISERKDISSLLESGNSNDVAAFLAFFQSEMERHLAGLEFGDIVYNQEIMNLLMAKY